MLKNQNNIKHSKMGPNV